MTSVRKPLSSDEIKGKFKKLDVKSFGLLNICIFLQPEETISNDLLSQVFDTETIGVLVAKGLLENFTAERKVGLAKNVLEALLQYNQENKDCVELIDTTKEYKEATIRFVVAELKKPETKENHSRKINLRYAELIAQQVKSLLKCDRVILAELLLQLSYHTIKQKDFIRAKEQLETADILISGIETESELIKTITAVLQVLRITFAGQAHKLNALLAAEKSLQDLLPKDPVTVPNVQPTSTTKKLIYTGAAVATLGVVFLGARQVYNCGFPNASDLLPGLQKLTR